MQLVSFFTTKSVGSAAGDPGSSDWTLCHYNENPISDMDYIQCDDGVQPLTKQVAVKVGYDRGVQLIEFEVYGLGEFTSLLTVFYKKLGFGIKMKVSHRWSVFVRLSLFGTVVLLTTFCT